MFLWLPFFATAEQNLPDSLNRLLKTVEDDSARYQIFDQLFNFYLEANKDSALPFIEQCLLIARKNNKSLSVAACLDNKGTLLRHLGRYTESLQCYLEGFEIAQNPESEKNIWILPPWMLSADRTPRTTRLNVLGNLHMGIGLLFERIGNTELLTYHFSEARKIGEQTNGFSFLFYLYASMGLVYKNLNKLDSALVFEQKAWALSKQFGYKDFVSRVLAYTGDIHLARGNIPLAREFYHEGLRVGKEEYDLSSLVSIYFGLAKSFIAENEKDSSLYYAKKAKEGLDKLGPLAGTVWNLATAYENLFLIYKLRNETDSAYKYIGMAMHAKDSLDSHRIKSSAQFQDLFLREQLRLKELEKDRIQFRNRVKSYSMLAGISGLLLLAIIFYRNNKQKQKAKLRIEKAFYELKSTQTQLIHREKMASLGELTAGIAHEIQNPLNFVNNFSEVNTELIAEMKEEINKGNLESVKSIANDLDENEQKVILHGKRADAIVKSMLQHSRSSTGKKVPTDLNALVNEYLKLAYHGMRAKDKSFNVTMKTDFDESIGKINIIPQDIGRVILNLINNAFYAVTENKNKQPDNYEPSVIVTNRRAGSDLGVRGGSVEISVKDNGNGIPQRVLDKIFQPFFTTKPTGQGTGLGLSLSYDIVKAHGGELKVETKEGEGSEFIIQLPIN